MGSVDDIVWESRPVGELPSAAGAYILAFSSGGLEVEVGALGVVAMPAGRLRYYGSAKGPGGLKARIERHLREDASLHWHVDYLADALEIERVGYTTEVGECDLVGRDLESGGWRAPVDGFGASDCSDCPAHLLARTSS